MEVFLAIYAVSFFILFVTNALSSYNLKDFFIGSFISMIPYLNTAIILYITYCLFLDIKRS